MSTAMQGQTVWAANANEDLSSYLHRFIKIDSDGGLLVAGVSSRPLGVCVETATLGLPASVLCDGIGKIELGDTVAAGALVMPDSVGRAVTSVGSPPGDSAGMVLLGGAVGELVPILLSK